MTFDVAACKQYLDGLNLSDKEIINIRDTLKGIAENIMDSYFSGS